MKFTLLFPSWELTPREKKTVHPFIISGHCSEKLGKQHILFIELFIYLCPSSTPNIHPHHYHHHLQKLWNSSTVLILRLSQVAFQQLHTWNLHTKIYLYKVQQSLVFCFQPTLRLWTTILVWLNCFYFNKKSVMFANADFFILLDTKMLCRKRFCSIGTD